MKLCRVKFCDFVVWGKDSAYLTQRIKYDEEFTKNALVQVKSFTKLCLLPELLSRCFTSGMKKTDTPSDCESDEDDVTADNQLLSQDDVTADNQLLSQDDVTADNQLLSQDDFTAEQSTSTSDDADLVEDDNELWCYCRQGEHYDEMIACDGENYVTEWYHLSCVNLTQAQVPSSNWYCPDCATDQV